MARKIKTKEKSFAETHADSVHFYPDSADYYQAFCQAGKQAKKRLILVGWDFDVRVALERHIDDSGKAVLENKLGDFLNWLVEQNPKLEIYLLIWDSPYLFGTEKSNFKNQTFEWLKHKRIHLVFEAPPSLAASLHEKFIIVDNTLAFLGGMDITAKRWDTGEHKPYDARRMDPEGKHFLPYHDFQVMMTGPVVKELERLASLRWRDVTGEKIKPLRGKLKPVDLTILPPTFYHIDNVDLSIQLTRPKDSVVKEGVFQIKDFYRETIKNARRYIYIENQYFADEHIAAILRKKLKMKNGPQVILLIQEEIPELMGKITVGGKSAHLLHRLIDADKYKRLSIIAPRTEKGVDVPVKVHSKLIMADDEVLAVGTPNLNKRSFQLDYEVNLAFHTTSKALQKKAQDFLLHIIGRHANKDVDQIRQLILEHEGQWRNALKTLAHKNPFLGWRTKDNIILESNLPQIDDASEPMMIEQLTKAIVTLSPRAVAKRALWAVAVLVAFTLVIVLVWYLAYQYDGQEGKEVIRNMMNYLSDFDPYSWRSFFVGTGIVALSTFLFVPVVVPILGFSAFWGATFGGLVVLAGLMVSGHLCYGIGRLIGMPVLHRFDAAVKAMEKIRGYGVWTVFLTRIVPTAPFLVVNFLTGSLRFKLWEMFLGSLLGLAPGVLILSTFGGQLRNALMERSAESLAAMVGLAILYLIFVRYIVKLANVAIKRMKKKRTEKE